MNKNIYRAHQIKAKAILKKHQLLKLIQQKENDQDKTNLFESAIDSLIAALELQPENKEIKNELQ